MAFNIGKISLNASVQNLSFKITGSNTISINFGSELKSYELSDKETVISYTFDDDAAKDIIINNAAYIKILDVSKNIINTIKFENCVHLNKFIGYNNNIQSLDFTNCDALQYVHIQNNPMCTDKEKMTNMINTLTDRNQRAFGSIVMYDFVPPKDFDTMDEDKRSIRELRKELEKVSIPKDWYFGSAIIYDEVESKKLTDSVLRSNAVDIWESAEYGEGLVYADMYNYYIMNETSEWDQSIFLKKYDISDGTFDVVDSTQTDEIAKSYDTGHGTSVTSVLMSQGNKMYGLIPKAKVVGIYGGKNRTENKVIQKKSIDKLNELEKLDFIVQTSILQIDQTIGLYPEYDNAVRSLLDKYKAIWFACSSNNGDNDDETPDKIAYAPYAHLVSGSHLNIDTQKTSNAFAKGSPSVNSEYIKFTSMYSYNEVIGMSEDNFSFSASFGTSYTTPYTAGVYGLLKILYEKKYKDYTLENLERYAYNHAKPLIYNVKQNSGYGILDCMYFHDTSIDTEISNVEKLEDTIDLQYTNNLNSVLKVIPENTTNKNFHLAKKYPQDIIIDDTNTIYPLKNDGSTVSKKLYSSSDNTKFETINIKFPNNKKYDEITDGLVFSFSSENTDFRDDVSGKQLVKTGNVTFDGKKIKFEANSGLVLNDFVMEDQITIQFCVANLNAIKTSEYPVYLYNNASGAKEKIVFCAQYSSMRLARQFGGLNGNTLGNNGINITSDNEFTVITMTVDFNKGILIEYSSGIPYNSDKISQIDFHIGPTQTTNLDYFRTIKKVNTLVIGNKSTLTGGGCVNTDLYGVRIFNRVLSPREVAQNTSALMMNAQVDESLIPDNSYKGTVSLIAGIGQANGQSFALIDGAAVQYKTEVKNDGSFKSVTDKIEEIEANNNLFGNITNEEIEGMFTDIFGE